MDWWGEEGELDHQAGWRAWGERGCGRECWLVGWLAVLEGLSGWARAGESRTRWAHCELSFLSIVCFE